MIIRLAVKLFFYLDRWRCNRLSGRWNPDRCGLRWAALGSCTIESVSESRDRKSLAAPLTCTRTTKTKTTSPRWLFRQKNKNKIITWLIWLIWRQIFDQSNSIFDQKVDQWESKGNFGRPMPTTRWTVLVYRTSARLFILNVLISKDGRKMIATRGGWRSSGSKHQRTPSEKIEKKRFDFFLFYNKRIKRIGI